jgi:aspartyl/asparaginyl beta-hydroxylase (cupin superfamily)
MWRLSGSDMFLLWKDVETRFGHGLARVEEMLVAMTGPGFDGYLPANQKVQDFCLPGLASRPWFERGAFDWIPFIEAQAQAILEEFLVAGRHLDSLEFYLPRDGSVSRTSDPRLRPPEEGWQALFLCRDGRWIEENCLRCPVSMEALQRANAGFGDMMFSVLKPMSEIIPHYGLNNLCLTCHLGLVIPSDCGIEVEGERRTWRQGECLIFDDTFLHRAWNASPETRVVLLFDFWHPDITRVEQDALQYLVPRIKRLQRKAA